jgi:hypothetical protein
VDSDTLVQQLLQLDDEELAIPINDGTTSLASAVDVISSADTLLCPLQDDDASDPETVHAAKQSKYWSEWLSAIHEELESLKAKEVYEEVQTLPPNRKAVQCKWVLHIKRDKTGGITHHQQNPKMVPTSI